jgi:hypothetical protein
MRSVATWSQEPDAVEQRTDRPVAWQRACHSHSHNYTTTPHPPSSDRTPPPSYPINLKLGKNIEQQPYDGSPANQGAAAP